MRTLKSNHLEITNLKSKHREKDNSRKDTSEKEDYGNGQFQKGTVEQ